MLNKKVFYFPFINLNHYVDISKESIESCGFNVLDFKNLFLLKNLFNRKNNIVILNWYEDRLYQSRFGFLRFLFEHTIVFAQLCVMSLFTRNIIWVRHNYKPHNRLSAPFTHKVICSMLKVLASKTITLEETPVIHSTIAPHPLYKSDDSIEHEIKCHNAVQFDTEYLFFGAIKPYKRLHDLLECWPSNKQLKIVGQCQDPIYIKKIETLITTKNLNVEWKNTYISDDELNKLLCNTKFVIMPHSDDSMISSGTFYQAITYGVNIVCFDSYFARDKREKHKFVHIVSPIHLGTSLEAITPVPRHIVLEEALRFYNREIITKRWGSILNNDDS